MNKAWSKFGEDFEKSAMVQLFNSKRHKKMIPAGQRGYFDHIDADLGREIVGGPGRAVGDMREEIRSAIAWEPYK